MKLRARGAQNRIFPVRIWLCPIPLWSKPHPEKNGWNGKTIATAYFFLEDLKVKVDTKSKVLKRSIFDVNVYTADLTLNGNFAAPDIRSIDPNAIDVRWNDAIVAVALSDVSGLKESAALKVNGQKAIPFEPSTGMTDSRQSGIHARLRPIGEVGAPGTTPGVAPNAFSFQIELVFTGSGELHFAPAGRLTTAAMASDWPHPSFSGGFLPVKREISDAGFTASWQVPHLARSIPQAYQVNRGQLDRFGRHHFGVRYYAPVDFYDLVSRAAKYGILFLSFAFMAVFVMEMLSGQTHACRAVYFCRTGDDLFLCSAALFLRTYWVCQSLHCRLACNRRDACPLF